MTELYSMLNDTSDVNEIKNVLDTICYHLPSSVSGRCQSFVAKYTDIIVELIGKEYFS